MDSLGASAVGMIGTLAVVGVAAKVAKETVRYSAPRRTRSPRKTRSIWL